MTSPAFAPGALLSGAEMAQRFQRPIPQWYDDVGVPREGCRLFFYQTGTSTKLSTYKDAALGSANLNPIVLDEFGEPEFSIFLKNQDYKVVLAGPDELGTDDPPTNVIKTWDPVRSSDFSIFSIRQVGSGNPNGIVAGTAASAGVLPSEYWDFTNYILYICTTTGTTLTAVWTALNANAASPAVPPPQGRLTLTSGVAVIASDVTGGAAVYYTPYTGNLVPIYNGLNMTPTEFSELTLTLAAQHAISTIYDVFVFSNSGVLTLVTGPAWSVSTAASGARGTGASTTELTRIKGLWTNAVQIAGRNGATTYTIGANLATYLGTICIDGSAGQVTCHRAYGQSRKFNVWNAYNRVPIILKAGDATASWSYGTATFRASNNAVANSISILNGLPEEMLDADFFQILAQANSASGAQVGVGYNSVTAASGFTGQTAVTTSNNTTPLIARHSVMPAIGLQVLTLLEKANGAATTWSGTEASSMMTARWRG